MSRFTLFAGVFALAGLATATMASLGQAATSPSAVVRLQMATPAPGQAQGIAMSDAEMMALHQTLIADLAATETRLDTLVAKMDAATGTSRVNAIAETLTALRQQQKVMHVGMMQMMRQMHGPMAVPVGGDR